MNDVLGLRDRPAGPTRRVYRRRRVAVLVLAVIVLAGAVYGGIRAVSSLFGPPADYTGAGGQPVVVQVTPGESLTSVGQSLQGAGVVASVSAFTAAAAGNAQATSLQPGYYQLRKRMQASQALALLLSPASKVLTRVTIPEGTRLADALAILDKETRLSAAQVTAAASHPDQLGLPSYAGGKLEGFLFPATYMVPPDMSATDALRMMVARFGQAADAAGLDTGAAKLGLTPYQVLIIASLVQAEAAQPADFPKVSRVVYNRLKIGRPLQFDSTINYVLPQRKSHLSDADTRFPSPYNTYLHAGLPPTPIDSPGDQALEAALHPADGDWLYFVIADRKGDLAFTADQQEFARLVAKAQAEHLY